MGRQHESRRLSEMPESGKTINYGRNCRGIGKIRAPRVGFRVLPETEGIAGSGFGGGFNYDSIALLWAVANEHDLEGDKSGTIAASM